MKYVLRWMILVVAVAGLSAFLYSRSDYRKLVLTDTIYRELAHPSWSTRLIRAKKLYPNTGSGDFNMLYLVDVRRVEVPLSNAILFYEQEGDLLGFKEFHVDAYAEAARKFQEEWDRMGLQVPQGENVLVLSQLFPASDGNIRRHEPVSDNKIDGGK